RAVVFESIEDYKHRINDPDLDVDADSVLVLKGCGPKGYPGMPEVGNMGLPLKLLKAGVTDMVRISDARMSGTAFGTVVLHVAPESSIGGPLAAVREGDMISLDVKTQRLDLEVSAETISQRLAERCEKPCAERGYTRLFVEHVTQADKGLDFDFLQGASGTPVLRESH
ncbi:MAG: dihydroxy-acid dehydratase, partial [Phycisphaerales bacterium]|nr:dihydroxy-acid dehydratase [Phycisphaerales bacterium]